MKNFELEYARLNHQQRQAVDNIEGPLLVVAGPGTGKTQLLSMRVANILKITDTDSENILCLTFTNFAAINMRERLLALTNNAARGVSVKTFHSFAAEIMNCWPEYFWNGARVSLAPDVVQLEIIQNILGQLPLHNPLASRFAGNFTATADIQRSLKLTKEAGLTPEKLKGLIELNLAYIEQIEPKLVEILSTALSNKKLPELQAAIEELPEQGIEEWATPLLSLSTLIKESLFYAIAKDAGTGKTKNTGKWKGAWVQTIGGKKAMFAERKRNEWWLALSEVYEHYRNALHQRGHYDYADMLVEVITQLESNQELLSSVQERYLYVLIDEFQDTNAAQLRLAHLVADHPATEGKPNLMAVGDDDQSIYKFNGAELNNMLSFRRSYPTAKLVVLKDNYRSSSQVLKTAKHIIEQAEDRLVNREPTISKNLRAMSTPKKNSAVNHYLYPTYEEQLSGIARIVSGEYASKTNSIAVLARSHSSLRSIASILLNLKIPINYEQQQNILDHQLVKQVNLLAKIVAACAEGNSGEVNASLNQLLRHPAWQINSLQLWELATANMYEPAWLESLLTSSDTYLQSIGKWLLWLSQEASYQPLPVMIEYFLGLYESSKFTSPLRDYFSNTLSVNNEYLQTLSAITLLRHLVTEFAGNDQPTLSEWIQFISTTSESSSIISDNSPLVSGERAVSVMTVHKAKGLEFDSVYIIDVIDNNWRPPIGGRKPPANLPLKPATDDPDDYARLLYVAATRARSRLTISSYQVDSKGNEVLTSPLVTGAVTDHTIIEPGSTPMTIAVIEEHLRWPRLDFHDEKALLKPRLAAYQLSVTHLLNFLDVSKGGPRYFLERNLLRLPSPKSATASLGTAIHSALETGQKAANKGGFGLPKVLNEYERALRLQYLPTAEFNRYLPYGCQLLTNLFQNLGFELKKGARPEQALRDVVLGNARIKGKLDKIELVEPYAILVSDYKTGKPLSSLTSSNLNLAVAAWKQRTQLTFYKILTGNSSYYHRYTNFSGQMIYIKADSPSTLVRGFNPSNEDVERLVKLVGVVWQHIIDLDFPDVSNYPQNFSGITQFENDLLSGKL